MLYTYVYGFDQRVVDFRRQVPLDEEFDRMIIDDEYLCLLDARWLRVDMG